MKRVKIYKAEIKKEKKGKAVVRSVSNKKGKFIRETSVMDSTFEKAKQGGDRYIIESGKYIEEVTEEKKKDELSKKKRDELAKEAEILGIKVVDSNKEETIISNILKKIFGKKEK